MTEMKREAGSREPRSNTGLRRTHYQQSREEDEEVGKKDEASIGRKPPFGSQIRPLSGEALHESAGGGDARDHDAVRS